MASRRNAGQVSLRLSLEDGETVRQALKNIGNDGERALRAIERAAPDASQGLSVLDDATRNVRDRLEGMAGSAGGAGRVLSSLGPFGLGAAAAVGIAVSLAAATLNAARQISDLRREAERAGQSFESFQELAVIANRTGIQVEALADGMRELQLRADEFVQTDGGAAKEAFERLGFDRASVQAALQDVDGFFDEVLGRIGDLDRAAQIRVLDELFGGTAGEQFTRLLDEGVHSLDAMRQAARDTGQVLSEEVGEEAEELRRKYDEAANILKVQMQEGLANLMPLMTALVDGAGRFLGLINDAVEAMGASGGGLEGRLSSLDQRIALAEANEARLVGGLMGAPRNIQDATLRGTTRETSLAQIRRELADMRAERQRLSDDLAPRPTEITITPDSDGDLPPLPPGNSGRSGTDREADRLERLAETYRRTLATAIDIYQAKLSEVKMLAEANLLTQEEALRIELDLRRELDDQLEKERLSRLAAATDAQSGAIRALEAIHAEATDAASQVEQMLTGAFSSAEDALVGFVTTGKVEFSDLVNSILADMARMAIRQGITAPLANVLGSVLSGLGGSPIGSPLPLRSYEGGGFTGFGSRSGGIDGRGGFLAINHPNESIIDHTRPGRSMANSSHFHIDARGAAPEAVARLEAMIFRLQQQLNAMPHTIAGMAKNGTIKL
ncbi:MAG: phage tail tape measure C-terminal domain-containing protein [Pseudomonadota bacterium]